MSNSAAHGLKAIFELVFSKTEQFIEVCPNAIWERKFGGWPIWQHVYHALVYTEVFALGVGDSPVPLPMPMEVVSFSETPATVWSKENATSFAAQKKAVVEAYFAKLDDTALAQKNAPISQRFGNDMSQAAVASLMSGHLFYHLGVCDSALREQGLQGVF